MFMSHYNNYRLVNDWLLKVEKIKNGNLNPMSSIDCHFSIARFPRGVNQNRDIRDSTEVKLEA